MKQVLEEIRSYGISKQRVYKHFGISRQGAIKAVDRYESREEVIRQIKELVYNYRFYKDRRAGSRNLYYNLNIKERFGMGINKFERLLSQEGLTLKPLKTRIITTRSVPLSQQYSNLTLGLELNGINQLVVGDITYLSIDPQRRWYLFCLMDAYSLFWTGACIAPRMRAKEALICLHMWFELRKPLSNLYNTIHHTDGGGQYFSRVYLGSLLEHYIRPSVAGNCLENGLAEQRNGFIKHHLLPTMNLGKISEQILQKKLREIMYFYNYERKSERLGWRTPAQFEQYVLSLEPEQRPVFTMADFA